MTNFFFEFVLGAVVLIVGLIALFVVGFFLFSLYDWAERFLKGPHRLRKLMITSLVVGLAWLVGHVVVRYP